MSTVLIDYKFSKHKAIIVGYNMGDETVKIDGIVIHTAFTLSDEVYLLENVQITPQDDLIYICGHGNASKQTIAGRYIGEIADFLIKNGWCGQIVYLTSCESNIRVNNRCTIAEVLDSGLHGYLMKEYYDLLLKKEPNNKDKEYLKGLECVRKFLNGIKFVFSDADGTTVTIQDNNSEPLIYVLKELNFLQDKLSIISEALNPGYWKKDELVPKDIDIKALIELKNKNYKSMQKMKEHILMSQGILTPTIAFRVKKVQSNLQEAFKLKCN